MSFLICFFFCFLVKRARDRWPLPVDRFVLSQSADVSPQQSKARSSFQAKYVFTLHLFAHQLGNRPSIYPNCCRISFGSIYIYANYCAESSRTGWLTRQLLNCSTAQVLWLRLRLQLWLWLWRRISGLAVSWLQSSFVPYSSWLGWAILKHNKHTANRKSQVTSDKWRKLWDTLQEVYKNAQYCLSCLLSVHLSVVSVVSVYLSDWLYGLHVCMSEFLYICMSVCL